MGLNSSKVVGKLSDNFKTMQGYSFRGGVKAMTEMAKLSVKMRMEISDMLGMADKFYEPEAAIEAAANLQMLGGEVASAFGDPVQMMYEARNAPEELAKRVGDVTKNMMLFNKETGEFEMPPEARMQIQSMAESLGLNKEQIIDTARQMKKMSQVKMDMKGNMFDEETQDQLANIATFDAGDKEWKVSVRDDETGKMVKKSFDELTSSDLKMVMQQPKTSEDAMMETAKASMTTNELLTSISEQFKTGIVIKTKTYQATEERLSPEISKLQETNQSAIDSSFDAITKTQGFQDLKNIAGSVSDLTTGLSSGFQDLVQGNMKAIQDSLKEMNVEKIIADVEKIAIEGNVILEQGVVPTESEVAPKEDYIMRKGQPAVSFTSEDDVISGKEGGPIAGALGQILNQLNQPIEIPKINLPSMKSPVDGATMKVEPLTGNINIGGTITVSNEDGSATSQIDIEKHKKEIEEKLVKKIYDVMANNWDGKNGGKGAGVGSVPM
jgi:hypothetical protein